MRQIWRWLESRSVLQALLLALALAVAIEAVTSFLRFGLDLRSTRDTWFVAALTFGIRIHHGYLGVLLLLPACLLAPGGWRTVLLAVGAGLLISDLVHHFLVLWPITGSPELHLRYPISGAGR